jgi:signal transduction histidine kinase
MTIRKLTALSGLGLLLGAASAVVALTNSTGSYRGASAAIDAVTVVTLFGVGLYAWNQGNQTRFGKLLVATGVCWFLASLSSSDVGVLYSVGRIAAWVFEAMLIYAFLAYPTGRLETRAGRIVVVAAALLVALLFLTTVPLIAQYPLPTPFSTCRTGCPGNSFFLAESEPGFIDSMLRPLRDVLTVAIYIAVTALLAMRLRAASHNLRRTVAPVLVGATLRFGAAALYVGLRRAEVDPDTVQIFGLITLLTVPLTVLGFLAGLLQWRIYAGKALSRLTTGLGEATDPGALRTLLADCLEDPSVAVYYAAPGRTEVGTGWRDSRGEPSEPRVDSGRCVTEATGKSGLRIAVECDEGFGDHPRFLRAVASCVLSVLERQRLNVALADSLEDVAASRKRLAAAGDSARQKIERDLHDGAQQQLVTLRVKLSLASEALARDPAGGAELVAGLGPEVEEIIEEVRALARGIYPPLLASAGLGDALRAAGQRAPLPVGIEADGLRRHPAETESAVYFCCLEALQNASKHAEGATGVSIRVSDGAILAFEVADDGCGFSPAAGAEGSGLTGMRDRLAALGGQLRIESVPGGGTRVLGRVPIA